MLVSVQLCRPAGRAGLAPAPAFTRSRWALRRVPPGHSLSLGAGAGSAEPGRQWEGNPPLPQPRPRRVSSSARGNVCSNKKRAQGCLRPPFPRARAGGGARPRGRVSSRPAGKGSGKDEQEPGLWGSTGTSRAAVARLGKGFAGPKGLWWGLKSPALLTWLWGEKTHHCVIVRKKTW